MGHFTVDRICNPSERLEKASLRCGSSHNFSPSAYFSLPLKRVFSPLSLSLFMPCFSRAPLSRLTGGGGGGSIFSCCRWDPFQEGATGDISFACLRSTTPRPLIHYAHKHVIYISLPRPSPPSSAVIGASLRKTPFASHSLLEGAKNIVGT